MMTSGADFVDSMEVARGSGTPTPDAEESEE
jgi:hypothetical protein